MAGVGHLKRIWKDEFRVTGAVKETHEIHVLGDQGGDFLSWHHFFMANRWSGKIAKRIGTRPSALHSTFHF